MRFACSKCRQEAPVTTRQAACNCGGLWQLDYVPPPFDLEQVDRDTWSLFRYRAFLPVQPAVWPGVSLGEGMTPVVPFSNDVLLKMDYLMPTLSYKDRGAAVLIAHCQSIGIDAVVQDSSGNAGNSVAAYCAKAGIACEIYVPEGTSPKKIAMIHAHQAQVHVVPGSRDHCAAVCRAQVASGGKYYASHVFNPFFYEGTKTYIYEVYEQLRHIPACLFTPLGNGTLFLGIVKGLEELLHSGLIPAMPRIVAVQSEHCDPIAQAVRQGLHTPVAVIPKPTLAEGIAIGQPMRGEEILAAIYRYKIDVVTAPEEQIIDAQAQLARRGIYCEPTSAATLAAYQALCAREGPIADCLIPITGAGLKAEH